MMIAIRGIPEQVLWLVQTARKGERDRERDWEREEWVTLLLCCTVHTALGTGPGTGPGNCTMGCGPIFPLFRT